MTRPCVAACAALLLAGSAWAGEAARHAILPPEQPWHGKSLALIAPPTDDWITPAEREGFRSTPSYAETLAFLQRLAESTPAVRLTSLGTSPEGRALWLAVVSKDGARTPRELAANGRPTLFVQAGIHAGEIDGKDAGLMLLRDLTVKGTRGALLEHANLLFLPIFNVDGHERSSPFGRINQRGPSPSGWRTTATNLNLNRDYAKLDAPEMRALVQALTAWDPQLYVDVHVTDGMDYQHDLTFGWNPRTAYSPKSVDWLDAALKPALERELSAWGHVPGPLIQILDDVDPAQGLGGFTADPRFSTGYGHARHLPTMLVETHSLKPYRQRVLATYVTLATALETLGRGSQELRKAIVADRAARPDPIPLAWKSPEKPDAQLAIAGIQWRYETSNVSGGRRVVFTGEPAPLTLPFLRNDVLAAEVKRPQAWWVPAAWQDVIARLELHGIEVERSPYPVERLVEMYRVQSHELGKAFEGHVPVTASLSVELRREQLPAGSVRVPADQPLGDLAALLLEPASPDSFFRWGFFLGTLQRSEYAEAYAMEPMATAMLAEDAQLKAEFEKRLAEDPRFAADPAARLDWFYRRTPFYDERYGLYPVSRELP